MAVFDRYLVIAPITNDVESPLLSIISYFHTSGHITLALFATVCLHINRKALVACNFKTKGLLKVTGSHVHLMRDSISETVQDGDITTDQ